MLSYNCRSMLCQVQVLLVALICLTTTTPSSLVVSASSSSGENQNVFTLDGEFVLESVPSQTLDDFKLKEGVKIDYDVILQMISDQNTLTFPDGNVISLDDLLPEDVVTLTATCTVDDESIPCPRGDGSAVFVKYDDDNHLRVQVNKDENGNIVSISLRKLVLQDESGEPTQILQTLEAVDSSKGVFTSLNEEAFDDDVYNQFIMRSTTSSPSSTTTDSGDLHNNVMDVQVDNMKRQLRQRINDDIKAQEAKQQVEQQDHRLLKTVRRKLCSEYKVVEVAIAAESTFCAAYGGPNGAVAAIQRIIADVSAEYEMDGLCYKVQSPHVELWCQWWKDPYYNGVLMNRSGCGSSGLLQYFQSYWNANRQWVHRDMAQLFTGRGLECFSNGACVIGCAYVDQTCSSTHAYGVNYVAYTGNTVAQANLVAHEMGHVLGAGHDDKSTGNIMYPSNGQNNRRFSNKSVNAFKSGNACVTSEAVPTSTPTIGPTASPTQSLQPSSSPSLAQSSSPSSNPSLSPSPQPSISNSPTISSMPTTSSPSASPTEEYVCEDDSSWWFRSANRNCPWVAAKAHKRCKKTGNDGTTGFVGCPATCGTCTSKPTDPPTAEPTGSPTKGPTATPTVGPTSFPTSSPSSSPSASPSMSPSASPSMEPSLSMQPTTSLQPTSAETDSPSSGPSMSPSNVPTGTPTVSPTAGPTSSCQDDPLWYFKKTHKNCSWVAAKAHKRCGKVGADNSKASDACPVACGVCSA